MQPITNHPNNVMFRLDVRFNAAIDLVPDQPASKSDQLVSALKALSDNTINGHQVLLLIREWKVCEPITLLDRIRLDVSDDDIRESDLEIMLSLDGCYAEHLPEHRKTAKLCVIACTQRAENIVHFEPKIRASVLPELIENNIDVFDYLTLNSSVEPIKIS